MWNPPSLGIELCIGRQILFRWATREVPKLSLLLRTKWMGLPSRETGHVTLSLDSGTAAGLRSRVHSQPRALSVFPDDIPRRPVVPEQRKPAHCAGPRPWGRDPARMHRSRRMNKCDNFSHCLSLTGTREGRGAGWAEKSARLAQRGRSSTQPGKKTRKMQVRKRHLST